MSNVMFALMLLGHSPNRTVSLSGSQSQPGAKASLINNGAIIAA